MKWNLETLGQCQARGVLQYLRPVSLHILEVPAGDHCGHVASSGLAGQLKVRKMLVTISHEASDN